MTKLNIGPGDHTAPEDWVSVDLVQRGGRVDVIGSLLNLPFADSSAEQIYCAHVLEHIELKNIDLACSEMHRVLTGNGILMVVGPDIARAICQDCDKELLESIAEDDYESYLQSEGAIHAWTATGQVTAYILAKNGFTVIPIPVTSVNSDSWPIGDRKASWQFALKCYPNLW